ncbi:MAG: diguanylate cyclase, partial [Anaerolineales bacterium]|nr:diguanylate cyclase [Anaerolineales bacterium]
IGVAASPLHGATAATLLRGADTALYAAKRAGRDQVMVAASSSESA